MQFHVVFGMPKWRFGGVAIFIHNLVRGLLGHGIPAHVLTTWDDAPGTDLRPPSDIPVKRCPWQQELPPLARLQAMVRYLEDLAPCIYLPGYDYRYSSVSVALSKRVAVVGHLHSVSSDYYDQFVELGKYWNATVAGSSYMAEKAASLCPELSDRLVVIPYGIPVPPTLVRKSGKPERPLEILYAGRFDQSPKRVLDLPKIIDALLRREIPVRLTLTGSGDQEQELRAACSHLTKRGIVRFLGIVSERKLLETYEKNDVIILTSEWEGKPVSLVEGMARGCVPVVSDIPSGIPEFVRDGVNGYVVPVGAIEQFADRLALLYRDPNRRRELSGNAYETVVKGGYRIEDVTLCYLDLFRKVLRDAESGAFERPVRELYMPRWVTLRYPEEPPRPRTWKDSLPPVVRRLGRYSKRSLRLARSAVSRVCGSKIEPLT